MQSLRGPVLLSLLMGLIFIWPNLLMPALQDSSCRYSPLVTTAFELEEAVYASGVREVFDGRLIVRDTQLFEKKNSPSFLPTLPYLVLGLMARGMGSVPLTFVVCDFVLPAVIFLLVYFLLFRLTRDPWVSGMGGAAVLLASHLIPYIPLLPHRLFSEIINYQEGMRAFERFSRLPYNQFAFAVLMVSTLLVYLALARGGRLLVVLAGVAGALPFYTYFYHYTFFTAGCSVFLLISLVRKDRAASARMACVLAVMALASIPFWVSFLEFYRLPQYADILSRMGVESRRFGWFQVFVFVQVAGYLLAAWPIVKGKDLRFYFLASFLIAGVLCYNIRLVLGHSVQSFHWSIAALDPFIVIFVCFVFASLKDVRTSWPAGRRAVAALLRNQRAICGGVVVFLVAYAFYTHTRFSFNASGQFCMPQSMAGAFRWLNENTEKDAVVASPSVHTINLLTAFTHCNNFAPNALMSTASSEEIVDRLAIAYRIFGVPGGFVERVMRSDDMLVDLIKSYPSTKTVSADDIEVAYWSGTFFHAKFVFGPWNQNQPYRFPQEIREKISRTPTMYVPLEVRESVLSRLRNVQSVDVTSLLEKYRLDYLIRGPYEEAIGGADLSAYGFAECVYDTDQVRLYRIRKPRSGPQEEPIEGERVP